MVRRVLLPSWPGSTSPLAQEDLDPPVGLLDDLVIVEENPIENFKVLYGTGAVKLNDDTGEVERIGGIKYTIKDGIIYDAKELLDDVAHMVERQKMERMGPTTDGS